MLVLALVLALLFLVGVTALASQNTETVNLHLLPGGYRWVDAPVWQVVAIAGGVGALFGLVAGLWGVVRRTLLVRRLRHQIEVQQRTIELLQQQLTALEHRPAEPPRALPEPVEDARPRVEGDQRS